MRDNPKTINLSGVYIYNELWLQCVATVTRISIAINCLEQIANWSYNDCYKTKSFESLGLYFSNLF